MADDYKVKVEIKLVKCGDAVTDALVQAGAGKFERNVSAEQAQNMDACEQILLETNYAAPRAAFAHHLRAVSGQYALEFVESLAACEVKP